jgi:C4-type Zn-finger protein
MVAYTKKIPSKSGETMITGSRCDRCGYISLDSDDDIWSAVGL